MKLTVHLQNGLIWILCMGIPGFQGQGAGVGFANLKIESAEKTTKSDAEGNKNYNVEWKPSFCLVSPAPMDAIQLNVEAIIQQGETENENTQEVNFIYRTSTEADTDTGDIEQFLKGMCLGERRSLQFETAADREKLIESLNLTIVSEQTLGPIIELVKVNEYRWENFPDSGLKVAHIQEVAAEMCGRTVVDGDTVAVEYEGSLEDGTIFDSSAKRGMPFGPVLLGQRQIIAGYELALIGRCLGERFKMIVPPHLAYGDAGVGDLIPPMATLVFDVRLVQLNENLWTADQVDEEIFKIENVGNTDTCNKMAANEDDLYVHYHAIREDGSAFGSAVEGRPPYGPFRYSKGGLANVPGLNRGARSMCLGERRLVVIPPRLSWRGIHDTIKVWVDLVQVNDSVMDDTKLPPLQSMGSDRTKQEL